MPPDPAARTALLISALMGFFTVGSGMAIFGPALPVFAREFGLDTVGVSWLVSSMWTGCLLGVVAMYFLSERVTARPGLAAMALGLTGLTLTPVWGPALVSAFVFGLGYGAVAALFNPRILVAFGARGQSMVSLINATFSLGAITAPYGFVVLGENPRPVFGALAALSAITFLVAGRAGMTGLAPGTVGRGFRLHLPILALALLAIGIEVSLAGLGPTALIRTGMTEAQAARLLSVFFLVALVTRLILTVVADRLPAFGLFTFAALWASACALATILVGPTLFFPAMGLSVGLFFQGEYVTAMRKMGNDPRVPSIILGTGQVGAIVSPLIYSRLMEGLGDRGLFWLIAVVAGGVGLVSLASYRAMSR